MELSKRFLKYSYPNPAPFLHEANDPIPTLHSNSTHIISIHKYSNPLIRSCICLKHWTFIHTYIHTYVLIIIHTYIYIYIHLYIYTRTFIHANVPSYAQSINHEYIHKLLLHVGLCRNVTFKTLHSIDNLRFNPRGLWIPIHIYL